MARAHGLAKHLAGAGVHIVSGGALGIDGAAHRGALAAAGTTTVVLGSGVDVAYPERHAAMFEQVIASGGALVSQLPLGTAPGPTTFVQRNPLIAALADVVLVIEADVRSGSLSTARAAKQLGRIVGAWPGSRGCDRLLGSGAALIESEADAVAALAGTPRFPEAAVLDPIATQVRDAIAEGIRGVDAIVRHTGLPVRAVLRALPMLDGSSSKRCS
jgi:DNA processing protein